MAWTLPRYRDEMTSFWPTVPKFEQGPALAWGASVCGHVAVILSMSIWAQRAFEDPMGLSRQHGAIQVRLVSTGIPRPVHAVATESVGQHNKPLNLAKPTETAIEPTESPKPNTVEQPSTPEAAQDSGEPSKAKLNTVEPTPSPGGRFSNLFAPLISRPMGRGNWQSPPKPFPDARSDEQFQREQLLAARRQQWLSSQNTLIHQIQESPLSSTCELSISISQSLGSLQCQLPQDRQRIAPMLSEFLDRQDANLTLSLAEICIEIRGSDWHQHACQAP